MINIVLNFYFFYFWSISFRVLFSVPFSFASHLHGSIFITVSHRDMQSQFSCVNGKEKQATKTSRRKPLKWVKTQESID